MGDESGDVDVVAAVMNNDELKGDTGQGNGEEKENEEDEEKEE